MTKNMTSGNEGRLIFLFTLPIMAGNFLQQLYNTADSIIVGRFVSQSALASVGTCTSLTMLFIALALGLSTGGGIIVSQFYGAGKPDEMRQAVSTSLILVTILGLILSVVGIFTAKPLLKHVLGVPDEILPDAAIYMAIYSGGLVFQFIYNMAAAVLRSLGDSKATLYFLLISSVMNVVLDLVFVICFHWGVAGAAVATIMSQCVSAAVSLVYMFKKHEVLRFTRSEFHFHMDKYAIIIKTGIPTAIQQCIVSMGHIAIQRVVNSFGTDMIAAITAAARVESYVLIPILGYQAGMATFSAQNVGAKQFKRVISGYKKTLLMVAFTCLLIVLVIMFFAGSLVKAFGLEGSAVALGTQYLKTLTPFFILFGCYICTSGLLQGAGDVIFAMLGTLVSLMLRIVLTYTLAYYTPMSYTAIWWAMPMGWVVCSSMVVIRLIQGGWKTKGLVR